MLPAPYTQELDQPALPLKQGATGPAVKRAQEWLTYAGFGTVIDGDFGPATAAAVKAFQLSQNTAKNAGVVDDATWRLLTAPLRMATKLPAKKKIAFGKQVVDYALQWNGLHEVGGDNRGPVVRHLCRGQQVAWCQGFASTMQQDIARHLGIEPPIPLTDQDGYTSLWVPWVVESAMNAGRLLDYSTATIITPGSFAFLRGGQHGHFHVAIVVNDDGTTIQTVEGNTNDEGSANGYEVAVRYRRKTSCDYGVVG